MSNDDEIEWVKEFARQQVRAAFERRDSIVESVQECIEEDDLSEELSAPQIVDSEIAALKEEQNTWPDVTDTDLLEAVFESLALAGIVPRHNFTCCGNCGVAEIGDEIDQEERRGEVVIGYVFYHEQDTEGAVDGYGLYFNYGAASEDATEQDHVAIGEALASKLRSMGLEVNWDKTLSSRVYLNLDWKRRWGSTSRFVQKHRKYDEA